MSKKLTPALFLILVVVLSGCKLVTNSAKSSLPTNIDKGLIFPNSSNEKITNEELKYCDKFTLLLAKNEIFARKGYKFNDNQLHEYFRNMSWYKPLETITPTPENLNDVEKQNFNLIDKSYNNFTYTLFNYLPDDQRKDYKQIVEKDLNNDGIKEKIALYIYNTANHIDEYTIQIISKGKEYKFQGSSDNMYCQLFFADFNTEDKSTEFYISYEGPSDDAGATIFSFTGNGIKKIMDLSGHVASYDGKNKIYADFSKSLDMNKIVLSYYKLGKGVVFSDKKEVLGKYLKFPESITLHKSQIGKSIFVDSKDSSELSLDNELVAITKPKENLKIIDIDYDFFANIDKTIVRNIPIKVETEAGKQGWLMWLNGGD